MNFSFKHYYWRWLKNLIRISFFVLCFMTIARTGFTLLFGKWSELLLFKMDLLQAFWLGIRYDLMPIAYINALPFLMMNIAYFIPWKGMVKITRALVISVLTLGYFLLIWVYIFDYGFFSYFQDHLNILVFGFIEDDTTALLTSVWKNYNISFGLSAILLGHWGGAKLIKLFFSPFEFSLQARDWDLRVISSFIVGSVLLAFFARGNFTRLPLSIEDAYISSNDFVNEVSLNGVITMNRAVKIRKTFGIQSVNYLEHYGFKDWQEAFKLVFPQHEIRFSLIESLTARTPVNPTLELTPPHVVVVIMESFGTFWNSEHSRDFNILGTLPDHFKEGLYFSNFLSSENGTIGSTVSVATSQLIRPGARFLSESDFMHTSLQGAAHIPYRNAGYETNFIYGGKLGWRDIGRYLKIQKYDKLWGADEIVDAMPDLKNLNPPDLGNEWGIHDEYLYSFIEKQLKTATRPQFFLVLTTSNHPPFERPSTFKTSKISLSQEKLDEIVVGEDLAQKRFLGMQYANQTMANFLSRIKGSDLKDNAVVALTGDHSFWIAKAVGHDQEFRRYAIPFFISLPDQLRPKKVDVTNFGSHEDIFPTLYNLTLSNQEYIKLGENLLSEEGFSVNSTGIVANKKGAYHHGKFWTWKNSQSQILAPAEENQDLALLARKAQALIGLTDQYLRDEKARMQTAAKNGPQ
jgi:phosphoglycerol transferase MdoB-like AlkP superfamily enzyme